MEKLHEALFGMKIFGPRWINLHRDSIQNRQMTIEEAKSHDHNH